MAEIIQRNDEYYVRFYGNGLLFEKYAGRDRARAEALLKEITDSLPHGAMSNVRPDRSIAEFFQEFKDFARARLASASAHSFAATADRFLDFLRTQGKADTKLSAVTPKVVEGFRDALSAAGEGSPDTNFQLYLLRCILDQAIKNGLIGDNPTLHVRLLPCSAPAVLEPHQITAMRQDATGRERLVLDYLDGAIPLGDKLKEVRWDDLTQERLRNSYIGKLLQERVSLSKIYENLQMNDITLLKPYVILIPSNVS